MIKQTERGVTMIEAIVVLGIAAIVMGGVWVAAASAINNQKKNELANQAIIIFQNARKIYGATQLDLSNLSTASGIKDGIFPPAMVMNAATAEVQHTFNGAVDISYDSTKLATPLQVRFSQLPQDACIHLLARAVGTIETASDISRRGVRVVSSSAYALTSDSPNPPYTITQITNICGPSASDIPGSNSDAKVNVTFGISLQ